MTVHGEMIFILNKIMCKTIRRTFGNSQNEPLSLKDESFERLSPRGFTWQSSEITTNEQEMGKVYETHVTYTRASSSGRDVKGMDKAILP